MMRRGHTLVGRWRSVAIGAAIVAASSAGWAQQDDATRAQARELAQRGSDAFTSGDFNGAQDLFHRAYMLVQAPSLSLREARALVKLGRLVEALDAYARTTRTPVDDKSPPAYREAVDAASSELQALRPRVPQLKIIVEGGAGGASTVTVDGKAVSPALIGVASAANPGKHEIVATSGNGSSARGSVELVEGETKEVHLTLAAGGGAVTAATTSTHDVSVAPSHPPQRLWGFVALGVGAAGLGTGLVAGLMATSKHSSAQSECPNSVCVAGSQGEKDLDSFRTLRTVSTIGYVVGGVGAAAGVTLLLLTPKSPRSQSASVHVVVSPSSLGVVGAF